MDENVLKLLLTPVCIGVVEALKQANLLGPDHRFAALASIIVGAVGGVVIGLSYGSNGAGLIFDAVVGLGVGAAATGLYAVSDNIGGKASS